MIKLNVMDYCHSCKNFNPIIIIVHEPDGSTNQEVRCERRNDCLNIEHNIMTSIYSNPDRLASFIRLMENLANKEIKNAF